MDFIIGGEYQGKLDYAREKYNLTDEDVFTCTEDTEPDWTKRCIVRLERYVAYCLKNDLVPEIELRDDAVAIGTDIFCGVVPIDPAERAWREECGRYYSRVSRMAEHVTRIFCSLPLVLK